MARARISPWRRMRRSRAPSNGLGRFFAAQFSAGCTTNMSGFDCRQAQGCNKFGNADQVVGDQIEQEVGGDATDAAMLGFAHGAVLLAPTEDAFDHRPARLRHTVSRMPRGSFVDGAVAGLAGFGD